MRRTIGWGCRAAAIGALGLLPRAAFAADTAQGAKTSSWPEGATGEQPSPAPMPAEPAAAVPTGATTQVSLRGDGITFHRQTGVALVGASGPELSLRRGYRSPFVPTFEQVCTAPCEASLPTGPSTFALTDAQ